MRKSRFTKSQIVDIPKEIKADVKAPALCRKHGTAKQRCTNWRSKYGGLEIGDLRSLRELEDEHRRLKKIVADQAPNMTTFLMDASERAASGSYTKYRHVSEDRARLDPNLAPPCP